MNEFYLFLKSDSSASILLFHLHEYKLEKPCSHKLIGIEGIYHSIVTQFLFDQFAMITST